MEMHHGDINASLQMFCTFVFVNQIILTNKNNAFNVQKKRFKILTKMHELM